MRAVLVALFLSTGWLSSTANSQPIDLRLAAQRCLIVLGDVPNLYDPEMLTYAGRLKFWYAEKLDRCGFDMSPELQDFYISRMQVGWGVECFVKYACTSKILNMSMSPAQFEAAYSVVARNNSLPPLHSR